MTRRAYQSSLRAEQVDRTREKLIEAAVDLVALSDEDLTVRRVAAHANVSVPTAYRYFPDREVLVAELATWINARIMGGAKVPATADGAPQWVQQIYRGFEQNDRFMRAQLNTPEGRLIREKNRKPRNAMITNMVAGSFPQASPTAHHRLAAMIQLLVTVPGWVSLHDNWGMNGDEAGRVTAWAVRTLVEKLHDDPGALDFAVGGATVEAGPPAPAASKPKRKPRSR